MLQLLKNKIPAHISDRLIHYKQTGRFPNIKNPKSFNERILHLRYYKKDERVPALTDKISAKEFVLKKLGQQWVTPSLFEGENLPPVSDRSWQLPYVLKASHGSYMNYFFRTQEDKNWPLVEAISSEWKKHDYGKWPYIGMRKWLLIEPMISGLDIPHDFKFFVFNGRVEIIQVDLDRFTNHTQTFLDRSWRKLPFHQAYPNARNEISPPKSLDQMIEGAETLAKDFKFVRVDFYEIDGRPRFGEMTFFPYSGLQRFYPDEFDFKLGALWS